MITPLTATNPIIILGSSNSFGHTQKAILEIINNHPIPIIDLGKLNIAPYDYEYRNNNDDYISLMERIVNHDMIVLATPVYWYSMSATMKIFIDRLADLVDTRKDLGQKLKGKKLFIISSFGTSLPKGFEDTFEQTCQYMKMIYCGTSFIYSGSNNKEFLKNNKIEIEKARKVLFTNHDT